MILAWAPCGYRTGEPRPASGTRSRGEPPTEADLRKVTDPIPNDIQQFLAMPPAPPAVQSLIQDARAKANNDWDRFNYLRQWVLDNVTAAGPGVPVSITPDRVQEILTNTKEASPFEMVALQAMLARWVGVPARIGYGFDGGDLVDGAYLVLLKRQRPSSRSISAATKWLPVIGAPKKAEATAGGLARQRTDAGVRPSDDIAVNLQIPTLIPPPSTFAANAARVLLAILVAAIVLGTTYVVTPRCGRTGSARTAISARVVITRKRRVALHCAE